jgi:hypothetical protein
MIFLQLAQAVGYRPDQPERPPGLSQPHPISVRIVDEVER